MIEIKKSSLWLYLIMGKQMLELGRAFFGDDYLFCIIIVTNTIVISFSFLSSM